MTKPESQYINLTVPTGWTELTDQQLKYVFQLLAGNFSSLEIQTLCLLRWSGTKVIGRQKDGTFLLKKDKTFFELTPVMLAEVLPILDWLNAPSKYPVRLSKIGRRNALQADFTEVSFETFIICDNLYQGYLHTENDELLDQLGSVLYGHDVTFRPYERLNHFYWFASLKEHLSFKYNDFFQPIGASNDGNLLGSTPQSVENAMNAQIRALTKGDVTKEAQVLALDTHRALTELNAQAREYKEMNAKLKTK